MSARHTFNLEFRGLKFTALVKQGPEAAAFDAFMRATLRLEKFAAEAAGLLREAVRTYEGDRGEGESVEDLIRDRVAWSQAARAFLAPLTPPKAPEPKIITTPDASGGGH